MLDILSFHEANDNFHYLGLPNCLGMKKSIIMGYLKAKVQNRVQSWDGKLLNKGGKEIPNYAMCVFLLPLEMCRDMEQIMCKFWWRLNSKKVKGIHWMSWDRMCKPKKDGGLGFRHVHDFNVALLGKQGWRLITNPESLVARIFKTPSRYLSAKLGGSPSYIWLSILEAQSLLK